MWSSAPEEPGREKRARESPRPFLRILCWVLVTGEEKTSLDPHSVEEEGALHQGGSPHTPPGQSARRRGAQTRQLCTGWLTWRHAPGSLRSPVRRAGPRGPRVSSVLWNLSKVSTMSVCRLYEQKEKGTLFFMFLHVSHFLPLEN